ncbi:hypothetical protein JOC25_002597 [Solibacillus kalamii]|nr:hypothetical protein [Solibacillus kalamii]
MLSGGSGKGRATADGLQETRNWHNIMLSTGEFSILNFVKESGGVAARCISLELKSNRNDQHFFDEVYKGLDENYGAAGYAFLEHWKELINEKGEELKERLKKITTELISNTFNQVIIRLARNFAIIVLAAEILNETFDFDIDISSFYKLFEAFKGENRQTDLASARLTALLDRIDSERAFGRKYYLSKTGDLLLPVQYLNDFLGNNSSIIRQIWVERGTTEKTVDKVTGKVTDYKKRHTVDVVNKTSHKRNTVAIKKEVIIELGYDYQI